MIEFIQNENYAYSHEQQLFGCTYNKIAGYFLEE